MEAKTPETEKFWNAYLDSLSEEQQKPTEYTAWPFGDSSEMADKLGALVASGKKTATSSLLWEYEADGQPLPKVGEHHMILGGKKEPLCIIEITEVETLPFNEVSETHARNEGEGDLSLEFWRKVHWDFFTRNLPSGKTLTGQTPVVCETFRKVF